MNAARNYVWTLNITPGIMADRSRNDSIIEQAGEERTEVERICRWVAGPFMESLHSAEKHKFSVFQLERAPSTGQLHLQGYSELARTARFNWIQRNWTFFATAHFEPRRGSQKQAIAYCEKEESRVGGPWSVGEEARQGQRSDLIEVAEKIKEGLPMSSIAIDHPASFIRYSRGFEKLAQLIGPRRKVDWEIEVIVYWGASGSGKTTKAKKDFPDAYVWMPQRGNTVWWDGYAGEEVIIIDEFANNFQYHYALRILNEPGVRVETKGGTICLYAKKIVLTSMKPPIEWWPSQLDDRYALYRRIHWCWKFSGNAKRGTQSIEIDWFPFEFEQDPNNDKAPRKWKPLDPVVVDLTALASPVNLPRNNSQFFEWDLGSTQKNNEEEEVYLDFNSPPVDWGHLFQ